ncbi:leucine-rich repeat domain-containing protein [Fluviispira vulneris]|uniref:leucine-rich repeat domain-containing protein n=1 Tax=Fluviispira vulneris TaxID=2763012 RepID=UPI001645E6D1|nr:leucine-rich repeat domain-containing protein [Fluviispira vulneris]
MFFKKIKSKIIFFSTLSISFFHSVSFSNDTCDPYSEIQEQRCLKRIEVLDLSNKKIKNIEEYFRSNDIDIQSVNVLNLNHNKIEDITYLSYFKNLRDLLLQDNKISVIPDSFANLTHLQTLDLSNNDITEIPDSFFQLTNLKVLVLNQNKLKWIPGNISQLINLEELYLNGKSRRTMKSSCFGFFGFQHGEISSIPESLTTLTKLRILDLSHNRISDIPDSFYNLTKLMDLDISDTAVSILPDFLLDKRSNIFINYAETPFAHTLRVNKYIGKVYEEYYIRKTGLI